MTDDRIQYKVPCMKCRNPDSEFYNDLMDYDSGKGMTLFLCDRCQESFSDTVKEWLGGKQ